MVNDEDRIPLSMISQYGYCPRRAALIMNHRLWQDNEYTAEGSIGHEKAHTAASEKRGDFIKLYDFAVWSDRLELFGKCDCIEAERRQNGALLPGRKGFYRLFPIEYKHGKVREEREYMQQLCAQAMCLEEMYGTDVEEGALFFMGDHRRMSVAFTDELRRETEKAAKALAKIQGEGLLPPPVIGPKCRKCSLYDQCMPKLESKAAEYIGQLISELGEEKI